MKLHSLQIRDVLTLTDEYVKQDPWCYVLDEVSEYSVSYTVRYYVGIVGQSMLGGRVAPIAPENNK